MVLVEPRRSNKAEHAEQDILFDDVGVQSEACSVEAHVKVTIAVEVVTTQKHMKVTNSMDHDA
jgi:hypothetical protein